MNPGKIILSVLLLLTFLSFKSVLPPEKPTTGVYGTCGCDSSEAGTSSIKLILNEDFTFRYTDNSNPAKSIDVKGNWSFKDNTILLKDHPSEASIETKWSIDANLKCLKSRKGLAFTRLCHIASC